MVRIRWVSFQRLFQCSELREHQEGILGAGQAPLVSQHLLPLVEPQCLGLRPRPPGGIFVGELKSSAEMNNLRTCLPFHWWDFSTTQALPRAVIKNKCQQTLTLETFVFSTNCSRLRLKSLKTIPGSSQVRTFRTPQPPTACFFTTPTGKVKRGGKKPRKEKNKRRACGSSQQQPSRVAS